MSENSGGNYLYNGAELPVLPDYDQAAYPYAILFYHPVADVASDLGLTTTDGYVASLNVCSKEGGVNASGNTPDYYCVQAPFNDIVYIVTNNQELLDLYNSTGCSLVLGEWCILEEGNYTGSNWEATPLPIHWANFDVKNADGSVYLEASDPVSSGGDAEGETTNTYDRDSFLSGLASGLAQTGSITADAEGSSWAQGYLAGQALAKMLPQHTSSTDVLDNTWPVEWNTLAVANNTTRLEADGDVAIKISALTPTANELAGTTLTATIDGTVITFNTVGTESYDVCTMAAYQYDSTYIILLSVTSTEASESLGGLAFPETGLYMFAMEEDVTFMLEAGEVPKFFFDSFPLDLTVTAANIGLFGVGNSATLLNESGSSAGTVIKISDLAPTLDELNSTYNTLFAAGGTDGAWAVVSDPSTLTFKWDDTGTFVKDKGNQFWVVYETQTLQTTPFDVSTPVTVDVTPGIYLSDKSVFAIAIYVALANNDSADGITKNDGVRYFLGTAEAAEKVAAWYST